MVLWTIYVQTIKNNDILEIEIDSKSTFLEFRKKVASLINLKYEDLVLASKKDYDFSYNSKKMDEIDSNDIYDQCTLMAVFEVNGGNVRYSLI